MKYFIIGIAIIAVLISSLYIFRNLVREAFYDDEYVSRNKGTVLVEIPETFELANIALAVTDYGLNDANSVFKKNRYYEKVVKHFKSFKNHPLISAIELDGKFIFSDYYGFRENSICYSFQGDKLIKNGLYSLIWEPDHFGSHISLIEDFAVKTEFRKFYKENLQFYRRQVTDFRRKVPVRKMWTWLETKFDGWYDCYKVIFSPLILASHSTKRFNEGNFKETVMFISGPDIFKNRYSGKIEEGVLSRIIFTEIDHNYVNPVTDKFKERVNEVFSDIDKWNRQNAYRTPAATFNEYMTWGVFTLYLNDNFTPEEVKILKKELEDQMQRRKFVKFREFNDNLLDIYLKQTKQNKISELFPEMINWAGAL